jgi:hypothetical protein
LIDNQSGSFHAATMDGTNLGCPCCNVHNCTHPLLKHRAHFCAGHNYKKSECVVADCSAPTQPGFQTCTNSSHRELEWYRNEKGKAFFQLKQWLQKSNAAHMSDSMGRSAEVDDEDEIELTQATQKLDLGNWQPKAHFGCRKTHNEQLIVACCGVITVRGTMFSAESISGVKVSVDDNFKIFSTHDCVLGLSQVSLSMTRRLARHYLL